MPCELKLHAHDVTLNCRPERKASIFRPPQRVYSIVREREMFTLGFDGAKIRIPPAAIAEILVGLRTGSRLDWLQSVCCSQQHLRNPLRKVVELVNSTPAFQLFVAGFHIGETIGMFDDDSIADADVSAAYRGLVGNLEWTAGQRGRLYFPPGGPEVDAPAERELAEAGRLFLAELRYSTGEAGPKTVDRKWFVPYVPALDWVRQVSPEAQILWNRIRSMNRTRRGNLA